MVGGHHETVRLLLKHHANRFIVDAQGFTVLDLARNHIRSDDKEIKKVIDLLKNYHPVKKKIRQWIEKSHKEAPEKKREIQRLIHQLGRDSLSKRREASNRLKVIGKKAIHELKKHRNHKTPEIRTRVQHIIKQIARKVVKSD